MAVTYAYSVSFDQLLDEPGMLNFARQISLTYTSGGATFTTTDSEVMKGGASGYDAERFLGNFVWIPSAAANNQIRTIVSMAVSTSAATVTTERNFDASAGPVTAYIMSLDPSIVMALANRALEELTFEAFVPMLHGPASGDMQGGNVDTDWTETNAADSVQTTASEVWQGAQSFVVTDSGSGGGYTESALYPVGQGREVLLRFVAKADVGTGILHALNASGTTKGSIQTTQEQWIYGEKRVRFDSTEEQLMLRIEGEDANASIDVQSFGFVRVGEYLFRLPAWIDERFKLTDVAYATFHERGTEDDTWLADSVEFTRLPKDAYRFVSRYGDANVSQVFIEDRRYLEKPLYLVVSCPFSAPYGVSTPFTSYTSTSICPPRLLVPAWKKKIGGFAPTHWPEAEARGIQELEERVPNRMNERPKREAWPGLMRF